MGEARRRNAKEKKESKRRRARIRGGKASGGFILFAIHTACRTAFMMRRFRTVEESPNKKRKKGGEARRGGAPRGKENG